MHRRTRSLYPRPVDFAWLIAPSLAVAALGALTWRADNVIWLSMALVLIPATAAGAILTLVRFARSGLGPSAFELTTQDGEPVFAVPGRYRGQAVSAGLTTGLFVVVAWQLLRYTELGPFRVLDRAFIAMAIGLAALALVLIVANVVLLGSSGPLLLRRDGISDQTTGRGWPGAVRPGGRPDFLPWGALAPDRPVKDPKWMLDLPIGRPDLVPGRATGAVHHVSLPWLDVSSRFLAGAIRTYLRNPERRLGIGTPEELARLRAEWSRAVR